MAQVDLKLSGAAFLGDTVDLKALRLGKVIDVVDHRAEFIDGRHRIGLARGGGAARAAHHRLDFLRRVDVARHEEKFHLGGDHGFHAAILVHLHHPAQHVARGKRDWRVISIIGVVDHLKRPVGGPGRGGRGAHVRFEDHVALYKAVFTGGLAPVAGDGLEKDRVGQVKVILPRELRGRNRLASGNAGQVGNDAFNLVKPTALKIGLRCGGQGIGNFGQIGHFRHLVSKMSPFGWQFRHSRSAGPAAPPRLAAGRRARRRGHGGE